MLCNENPQPYLPTHATCPQVYKRFADYLAVLSSSGREDLPTSFLAAVSMGDNAVQAANPAIVLELSSPSLCESQRSRIEERILAPRSMSVRCAPWPRIFADGFVGVAVS